MRKIFLLLLLPSLMGGGGGGLFAQTRQWGTYFGGSANDRIIHSALDRNGNLVIVGQTSSADSGSIATPGAHQTVLDGTGDCFIAKFNKNGFRLWGTYFGGSSAEYPQAVFVTDSGYILLTGVTTSSNGISTGGSHQPVFAGGGTDAFLAKFDSSGILLWSTYYGGTGWDRGYSVAADYEGNIILAGETVTSDSDSAAIFTPVSFQPLYGGGASDGFIAKFSSGGNRLWATYLGGDTQDHLHSAVIDSANNIIVLGGTYDTTPVPNAIATAGAFQQQNNGGEDSFIAKFDKNGNRLWGTYFGGNGDDEGYSMISDSSGNIIFCGYTTSADSTDGIASMNAHQKNNGGGTWDALLAKFDSSGIRLWGTFYGGNADDRAQGIATGEKNKILIVGFTQTSDTNGIISSANSWQTAYGGGNYDGFAAMFDSAGTRQWGTYYGGTGDDGFNRAVVNNPQNYIYIAGFTSTAGADSFAIVTTNIHQPNYGGNTDGFIVKFYECTPFSPLIVISDSAIFCTSDSAVLDAGNNFTSYLWNTGATTQTITLYSSDTVWVTVSDTNNCTGTSAPVIIRTNPLPLPQIIVIDTTIFCTGDSAVLDAGNNFTSYLWNTGATTQTITLYSSDTIWVTVSDSNNCTGTSAPVIIKTNSLPFPQIIVSDSTVFCTGDSAVLDAGNNFTSYLWNTGATTQTITLYSSDTIWVTVSDTNNCTGTSAPVIISVFPVPVSGFLYQLFGDSVVFTDTAVVNPVICNYLWDFGDSTTSALQNPSHTYSANGTYNVCYSIISCDGCADSSCQTVIVSTVGLYEANNNSFLIYPNPTSGTLRITFATANPSYGGNLSEFTNYELEIYNVLGEKVFTSTINHQPSSINHQPSTINHQPSTIIHQPSTINHQPSTINHQPSTIIHLKAPSGIYLLKISSEKNNFTTKVIRK